MAYAAIGDVTARMAKFTVSSTTKPTTAQVTEFLDDISGEIDVHLAAKGCTVPATTPVYFMDWLKGVCANGTAALALKSMFPDAYGPAETPAYKFFESMYTSALESIDDGMAIPPDLITGVGYVAPSTYLTRNSEEDEDLGTLANKFMFPVDKVFSFMLFAIGMSFWL